MDAVTRDLNENIDMEHVAESALDELLPGKMLTGEIVTLDNDYAYVNIGSKSDGRIPLDEFSERPAVGTAVTVMLQSRRLVDGLYQLSMKAAQAETNWQAFSDWYEQGNRVVQGRVTSATGKGKTVLCMGLQAFLPFSLAGDLRGVNHSEEDSAFKVIGFDRKKKSILLSRKDLLEEETKARWESFVSTYKVGDVVKGTPIKYVEFGVFVRVAGIDALLHRNDMTWRKVFKQRKIVKLGEERDFVILDIRRDEEKISLGLKQLVDDPWSRIEEKYAPNARVQGRVVTITRFGAFVELEEGVEGFVANQELTWKNIGSNVGDILKKGEEYAFVVLGVNQDERRISLGYKQLQANPWDTVAERFPVGSIHRKKVKKIVKFGMFVELEPEIDGLVHLSDVSWDDSVRDCSGRYHLGDEVEVKILDIKRDEMKIACGIKQLTPSPWEEIAKRYPPRLKVEGTISGITQFGMFVRLDDDVEGLVHISEISRRRIENLNDHFKVGDHVNAIVLGVDVNRKRLSLSIKHLEIMNEKEELDKIMRSTRPSTVTLGEMIDLNLGK